MLIRYLVCFFLPIGLALLLYAALGPWLFELQQASGTVMRNVLDGESINMEGVHQVTSAAYTIDLIVGSSICLLFAIATLLFAPKEDLRKSVDISTALCAGIGAVHFTIGFPSTSGADLAKYVAFGVLISVAIILLRRRFRSHA